jgi:hypothetical protein
MSMEAFFGNTISANFTTLMRQASMTADDYLSNAIADVEKRLGKDAAKKYAQIVAAYMQAAATDLHGSTVAQTGAFRTRRDCRGNNQRWNLRLP